MKFKERISEFMYVERLNITDLANKIGVSKQNISQYRRGTLPNFDFFQKMALHFNNLDLNWLIAGRGEMYLNSKKEYTNNNQLSTVNETHENYKPSNKEKMNNNTLKWMQEKIDELMKENQLLTNELLHLNKNNVDQSKEAI